MTDKQPAQPYSRAKPCHSCQADKKRRDVPAVQAKKPTPVVVVKAVPQDQVESAYTKIIIVAIKEMENAVISRSQVEQIKKALQKILKVKG